MKRILLLARKGIRAIVGLHEQYEADKELLFRLEIKNEFNSFVRRTGHRADPLLIQRITPEPVAFNIWRKYVTKCRECGDDIFVVRMSRRLKNTFLIQSKEFCRRIRALK